MPADDDRGLHVDLHAGDIAIGERHVRAAPERRSRVTGIVILRDDGDPNRSRHDELVGLGVAIGGGADPQV